MTIRIIITMYSRFCIQAIQPTFIQTLDLSVASCHSMIALDILYAIDIFHFFSSLKSVRIHF
jgi:hypothetical protein